MEQVKQKQYFSSELLSWYRKHKRDLPWRQSRNPYHIWVSEIMLQQTRVETVIPYFHRFIDQFPTIGTLADAPEEEVLKAWEGLGYYSRARNLQSAIREVKERYGGTVPDNKEEIFELKGVGPYTAGAILSIAYNKPEPAVDGNVMRVLSRYFLIEEDITKTGTRAIMEKLARELIPEGAAGEFNQGLMDFGSMICTPKSPNCLICPVMDQCAGRAAGMEESLPVKKKAKPPRPEQRVIALIEGTGEYAGYVLIRQRPQEGLLARLWELPHVETRETLAADALWSEGHGLMDVHGTLGDHLAESGIGIGPLRWFMRAEHTFSHIHWNLEVFTCKAEFSWLSPDRPMLLPSHYRWVNPEEMAQFAFPNVFLRILNAYFM